MKSITDSFPVTNSEYEQLHKEFYRLCWKASHELKRKNSKNNYIDDVEDIQQDLLVAMMKAGSYNKRQVYINKCLNVAKKYAKDVFTVSVIEQLDYLWLNRKRHGANRQKYGPFQEAILERIIKKIVPKNERPNKEEPLKIDSDFTTYCKSIVWNEQKAKGKKITRNKVISNTCSLSEFDYLQ